MIVCAQIQNGGNRSHSKPKLLNYYQSRLCLRLSNKTHVFNTCIPFLTLHRLTLGVVGMAARRCLSWDLNLSMPADFIALIGTPFLQHSCAHACLSAQVWLEREVHVRRNVGSGTAV